MHSNSASSPSSNIPMKKKAKVDNIESSANSDTDSLPNNHHAIRHQTSERAQRCSRFSSLDATSASCSNPAEVLNICKRSSQHSDKEMLGGRHSSSVASSLKHSHESSNPSRSHREQNLHLFGSQAYKHGDSESPGLTINGHSSCRFSLDSKCSSRRSSGSQSPYVHGKSNNDDRCKYGTLGSSSNEVNKNLEVTNIGRASLRKSSLPCTTGHHSTKQPTSDLGRGEGTVNRYVRELEQRVLRSDTGVVSPQHVGEQNQAASMVPMKKSPPTYRTVLAKRGLIVRDTLGSGSYSKVKLAVYVKPEEQDAQLYPDQVAVKIIDRKSAPRDFQEKFLPRELEMWPHLSHSSIVQMLHYFTEGYRVYMILEFIEGGDALRYIQNKGAVSEGTAKSWVHQVADAVMYLHDLQITHRDLKLENMLIDRHNNIKICDFGFVRQCTDNELSKTFCGSKSYAAPEILKGEPYPPKKADVWAIGVILFILVTGRMPFDETKGNTSLLDEHRRLDLQWPRGRRAVTTHCKALSIFCLKFLWADRPTIHQVMSHLWFKEDRLSRNK